MALQTPKSTVHLHQGNRAGSFAVGQHLSQFVTLRATMSSPSKSPGMGCHLCHPQEARWRHPHATFHASSVQGSSEVRTALPTCVFCVCSHLPVGKAGNSSAPPAGHFRRGREQVCDRNLGR